MYLTLLPLFAGIPFAASQAWKPALILFALGMAVFVGEMVLFSRRVARLRRAEQLTSRDLVEIEYPRWVRRGVVGYLVLLAGMTGILILGAVIFVIVTAAS